LEHYRGEAQDTVRLQSVLPFGIQSVLAQSVCLLFRARPLESFHLSHPVCEAAIRGKPHAAPQFLLRTSNIAAAPQLLLRVLRVSNTTKIQRRPSLRSGAALRNSRGFWIAMSLRSMRRAVEMG